MIKTIHSYWAYVVLILLLFTVIKILAGWLRKKQFKKSDYQFALFALIATHIQLLIGLVVFYFSDKYMALREVGMGEVMKNAALRKVIVEHPVAMLAAVVLVTIGWSKHKRKRTDNAKLKTIGVFYTLALLLVLYMVPVAFWSKVCAVFAS